MRSPRALPLLLSLGFFGSGAAAQTVQVTGTLQVTAVVPAPVPTGTGLRNLRFGSITPSPGAAQTIDVVAQIANGPGPDKDSGEFGSAVAGAAGILVRIAPPAQLVNTANSSLTMAVDYSGTTHGAYCWQDGTTLCSSTLTSFDPVGTPDVYICRTYLASGKCKKTVVFGPGTMAYLFVGGTLTVGAGQPAGSYTGTMTMTVLATY